MMALQKSDILASGKKNKKSYLLLRPVTFQFNTATDINKLLGYGWDGVLTIIQPNKNYLHDMIMKCQYLAQDFLSTPEVFYENPY